MSYEVLARKWRPQQFSDVVGQGHVTQTLENAIKTDRIAHAYLFVGPRGIGKTSIARIFAKALNCEKGPTATPCGVCNSCVEITRGNSMDVLEIDGASNNGVDQVRELRDTVKYAPVNAKFKIYVIDEVHMLSSAAFNALLKTLEEPPSHVKFIFATTEPEKILPTIVSRCQRFDLRRIDVVEIIERLRLIAKEEKIEIDDDALVAIARGAEGGLRDAESAFDQLISFCGNKICENDVLSVFGLVSRQVLEWLAKSILKGDIKTVINIIHDLDQSGKDLQRLVVELLEHFRNLLICLNVGGAFSGLDLTESQISVLKEHAQLTDTGRALRIADILSETIGKMRFALSRRTVLEMALIRASRAAVVVSLEEILKELNALKKNLTNGGSNSNNSESSPTSFSLTSEPEDEPVVLDQESCEEPMVYEEDEPVIDNSINNDNNGRSEDDLILLKNAWAGVVDTAGKISIKVRSSLKDSWPMDVIDDTVVIGLDAEFAEEVMDLKTPRNRMAIEHALKSVLKKNVLTKFVVADTDVKQDIDSKPIPPPQKKKLKPGEKRTELEWVRDPAVQQVMEVFNGTVVSIRD